ncbi:MAG: UDP-N-acetylglucosamine 1-carboxyvinyltransferase [Sulfobacillus benefaciens]|uniref:UDP-N-acetylglucosamine 1-carboxyvinyltransferase n=1 Tax=Sulfobacillus benefaciens TaxID=453960 RepID=A0A2T2XFJ0_9FIRM|nr:MAG: UDP-N-acetylglucosamine 1-carboxyvinyltransferase [Sulfobacillus benefaciens]
MGQFVVRGGRRLEGTLRVKGSKNAALPIMAASILASDTVILDGVPRLRDIDVMIQVLQALGARVWWEDSQLIIDPRHINQYVVPAELMQQMRASLFVTGPLLARLGRAVAFQPGGCNIGDRPIDLHVNGLTKLGAQSRTQDGQLLLETVGLTGTEVHLSYPSVGATENIMMAAVLARGETRIRNAAMEPEIVDLAQFLETLGATIRGAGTSDVRIEGRETLHGTEYTIIPDRIEAGSFALAAALTGGQVRLENCLVDHLPGLWGRMREVGVEVREVDAETVEIIAPKQYRRMSISLHTNPYPGFATDLQPQFMAFLLKVPGVHLISERVFENRLGHAREFRRMGAQIAADQRVALIYGGHELYGAQVTAMDLRAGAGLILAGLGANGQTIIEGREVIERGYENLAQRLSQLGADVTTL